MTCVHPREVKGTTLSSRLFFLRTGKYPSVPCGQCMPCRIMRSLEWSVRLRDELGYWSSSCFLTLTYDDENIPPFGSLRKAHVQSFIRSLRLYMAVKNEKIKYYFVGEYGSNTFRPHYHAIIFGFYPDDIDCHHSSLELRDIWSYGFNYVGKVENDSIQYVTGYIRKKLLGKGSQVKYSGSGLEPPFSLSSNGIGQRYFDDHYEEVVKGRTFHGDPVVTPRYYKKKFGIREKRGLQQEGVNQSCLDLIEANKLGISLFQAQLGDRKARESASEWKESNFKRGSI